MYISEIQIPVRIQERYWVAVNLQYGSVTMRISKLLGQKSDKKQGVGVPHFLLCSYGFYIFKFIVHVIRPQSALFPIVQNGLKIELTLLCQITLWSTLWVLFLLGFEFLLMEYKSALWIQRNFLVTGIPGLPASQITGNSFLYQPSDKGEDFLQINLSSQWSILPVYYEKSTNYRTKIFKESTWLWWQSGMAQI